MKVQVIGHNGRGRGSSIIKWATRGRFSHTSNRFIFDSPEELHEISVMLRLDGLTMDHEIESIQGVGVHHQPFVASGNQSWFDFQHTDEQALIVFDAMAMKLGCKYDWRGIGGFATRRNRQHPDKWFCSELTCYGLSEADISVMNMPDHWITPNICCASPIFDETRVMSTK